MTFRKLAIATALLATTASYAVAQNTMSPASQARPGLEGADSSKPSGAQNQAGTHTGPNGSAAGATTGTGTMPSKETMSPASQARPGQQGADSSKPSGAQNQAGTHTGPNGSAAGATTGMGTNPSKETMDKNTSPASPNAGEKQQK